VFVSGFHSDAPNADAEQEGARKGIDACWISINDILGNWTIALNPRRRAVVGKEVVKNLLTMKREEIAKAADVIWKKHLS